MHDFSNQINRIDHLWNRSTSATVGTWPVPARGGAPSRCLSSDRRSRPQVGHLGVTVGTSKGTCSAPRCGRPRDSWHAFCGLHAKRVYRHGHWSVRAGIRESDLRGYREWVDEGLYKYHNTKAVQVALQLAEATLNYQPTHDFSHQRQLASMMHGLRDHGVTARDVLLRVCLFHAAFEEYSERFHGSQRAEDLAQARLVMRLTPLQRAARRRWPSRSLQLLGSMLREDLGPFALGLLRRLKADAEAVHQLRAATLDLDSPAE